VHPLTYENPLVWLVETLVSLMWLYTWVVVAAVVMSWLVAFGVLNTYNRYARTVIRILDALTEPVFRQVRRILPPISGLDLSPLIVIVFLQFMMNAIPWLLFSELRL
jgi:YggT family protein